MAISSKLKAFLDGARVKYTVAKHPVVYTAQEIAASQHVPGRQLAKSVLVKTDQGPVLAVLPAIHLIDLKRLKALLKTKSLSIGKEADIKQHFPDVEVGAMSPFGNIYQVPVAMDRSLESAQDMVFNGGTHAETIKIRVRDFLNLAKPRLGVFGQPINPPAPARKKKTSAGKSKRPASKRSRPKAAKKSSARKKRR